jgi:hypothetical protein
MQFTPPAPRAPARIGNRGAFLIGPDALPGAKGRTYAAVLAPAPENVDLELLFAALLPALRGSGLFRFFRLAALSGSGHFGPIFNVFHHIL